MDNFKDRLVHRDKTKKNTNMQQKKKTIIDHIDLNDYQNNQKNILLYGLKW